MIIYPKPFTRAAKPAHNFIGYQQNIILIAQGTNLLQIIGWIFNTTGLVPNSGRFEGFKSSGKIGTIENKELQNNIMDLYQENIPNLINSTNFYTSKKLGLFEYVNMNRKRITDSTSNLVPVLSSDPVYNICVSLTFVQEILIRYDTCINKMNRIISDINNQYGH